MATRCPSPVRLTGVIDVDQLPTLDWSTVTRTIWQGTPACCCCDVPCGGNVRASVPIAGVGRLNDGPALAPTRFPPDDMLPPSLAVFGPPNVASRLAHMPFVKARATACEPFVGSRFFDVGHSLVLPWCEGAVALMVPEDSETQRWQLNPSPDRNIEPLPGVELSYVVELWLWPAVRCTPCCPEPGYATLTDFQNIPAGGSAMFMVPPGACECTVYVTVDGGTTQGAWIVGAVPVGQWVFANAGFGSRYPHNFAVTPGVEALQVLAFDVDQPCAVAWKVRA